MEDLNLKKQMLFDTPKSWDDLMAYCEGNPTAIRAIYMAWNFAIEACEEKMEQHHQKIQAALDDVASSWKGESNE
tara:strand:+ start:2311 stop:2535 length:225 start_codon:yes stop_codon:yes gene_type:complete